MKFRYNNLANFFLENQGASPVPFQKKQNLIEYFRVLKLKPSSAKRNHKTHSKPKATAIFLSLLQTGGMNSAKQHMNLIIFFWMCLQIRFRHPPAMCFGGGKGFSDTGPARVHAL
jgi:hypothetical protein